MTDYKEISEYNIRRVGDDPSTRKSQISIYSNPAHFIYEILQNADDHNASKISFILENEALRITHDGTPFSEENVRAITYFGASSSEFDSNKTGRFGIGFKSVFAYTASPIIISGDESFKIYDLCKLEAYGSRKEYNELTTIILPFNHSEYGPSYVEEYISKEDAYSQIKSGLKEILPITLLFTKSLKRIKWEIESVVNLIKRTDKIFKSYRETQIESPKDTITKFHVFKKPVEWNGESLKPVEIAFRINELGKYTRKNEVLFVLFNSELHTRLGFILNGPFNTIPNRESIKFNNELNQYLIEEAGLLFENIILEKKKNNKLTSDFLEILPLESDEVNQLFLPIKEKINSLFDKEELVKTISDSYCRIRQGFMPKQVDLTEIISEDDISFLNDGQYVWLKPVSTNKRFYRFLQEVNLRTWNLNDLLSKLSVLFNKKVILDNNPSSKWLFGKNDLWLISLYKFLCDKIHDTDRIENIYIFKCHDANSNDNPIYFGSNKSQLPLEGYTGTIHEELFSNNLIDKNQLIEIFLNLGITRINEEDKIRIELRKYHNDLVISDEIHMRHMRKFISYSKKYSNLELFKQKPIFRNTSETFVDSRSLYLESPFEKTNLDVFYRSESHENKRSKLWNGYLEINQEDFLNFVKKLGVPSCLSIEQYPISYNPLFKSIPGTIRAGRRTYYQVSKDYVIEELKNIEVVDNIELSKLILTTIIKNQEYLFAKFTPNGSVPVQMIPSSIVNQLKHIKWIKNKDDDYCIPSEIEESNIHSDLSALTHYKNIINLLELGVNTDKQKIKTVLNELGADSELVNQIVPLIKNESDINEILKGYINSRQRKGDLPRANLRNKERRKEKTKSKYRQSAPIGYTVKVANKRDSHSSVKSESKKYLKSNYTNEIGELICQICLECMPFKLIDNSSYYFHSVEIFKNFFQRESSMAYLALCPNCSAKYSYFNENNDKSLVDFKYELLEERKDTCIPLFLKVEKVFVYFTEQHLFDIRILIEEEEKSM